MHRRTFARVGPLRARMFFYLCTAVALALTAKLCYVQLVRGPVYAREALAQRSDTVEVFARRGSITDRDGTVLVRSLPSQSVYVVPHDLTDPDIAIAKLERIFGKLNPQAIEAMHDRTRWFVWIARKVPNDIVDRVRALNLAGVQLKEEDTGLRTDTVGRMASTILGFVGTDENGLDGLEYEFDGLLKGTSGRVTLETDQFGRPIPFGRETVVKAAQPGSNLRLSIDSYLQYVAEDALGEQYKRFHALDGTAIVMDPWTGEILAMANMPEFDPNAFWKSSPDALRDRAVTDSYEPGSTFKLVTAAAALDSGKVTTSSLFAARDELSVGGRTIHNADDGLPGSGSSETLEKIIEFSHNVGAAEVGMYIGAKTFYRMERRAGFGAATDVGLPGESQDIVPPPQEWSGTSLATMSFGQGVSVTPIAMARFYCAIANGGILLRPRILHAIDDPQGHTIYQYAPEVERRVFSRKTAATLRAFLTAVVVGGTGKGVAEVAGYTTAGKTGTAQMVVQGRYEPGAYAASFIGMVPAEHPRYVIYVKLERPVGEYYGGLVAAPAFTKIARAAMLHAGVLPSPSPSPKPVAAGV
ncbi:MAG: penicillin-binding protein 2 [Candidatus Eremiobacteraeota bacterium]|nr:penicillin-binding protein 2 [Candidatus Eremiobacteraeota bacterium]